MNEKWPSISIVTPSFNQGKYVGSMIESVLSQDYPNLQHIVIDGGSTDGTLEILSRYPHLKVISESDHGQAEAINKGFRLATGEIWGFLNSDDTLLPGALKRVAQEIDPRNGRHIVMGRCRFIDEYGRFTGIEHPTYFKNHRRVLEIWKGHMLPQPAIFWTPEVWTACGSMDEGLKFTLDYDLFCRFSQKYRFYPIDAVLATYRLHSESKTEQWTEMQRLEDGIRISRRYWGPPFAAMYWQLTFSLAWYRLNRVGRARALFHEAKDAWQRRAIPQALSYGLMSGILAPEVAFYVTLYPRATDFSKKVLRGLSGRRRQTRSVSPQTAAYFDRTQLWGDRWAGPRLLVTCEAGHDARDLFIQGWSDLKYLNGSLFLTVLVDGQWVGQQQLDTSGDFCLEFPLPTQLKAGTHTVEVQSSDWFVPHAFARNKDYRPLSFRMEEIRLQ